MARYDSGTFFYDNNSFYDEPEGEQPHTTSTMIKLSRYFSIPFGDSDISLDELIAFATDSQQRMIANNPGALWNTLITQTTAALAIIGNCTSNDITKLALRKAAKQAKDTFRDGLAAQIAKIYGKVLGEYGDGSVQITQCFPQGRGIFGSCVDDLVDNHLQALINGLTPLGAPMATALGDAGGLLSTWLVIYAASEAATGTKTASQDEKATARAALELQLTINVLTIAKEYVGQPEKADLYFQQSLLEDHPAQPPEPEPPVPPVP